MILSPVYPLIVEVCFYGIFGGALYATMQRYGTRVSLLLLTGATLWSTSIENFIVLNGGYDYYGYATRNFPGYMAWVGVVPLWIILGWFSMTALSYILTDVLLPGRSPYLRSLLAASISLNIDLLLDPIAVSTGLWRWTHPSVYVLGVPLTNWVGWFAIVYFFVFAFDTMVINKPLTRKPLLEFRKVEWQKILTPFLKRLLFLAPIVLLGTLAVMMLLAPYSNLPGPYRNVFPAPFGWWS